MRVMPNMIVVAPCDAIETRKAVIDAAGNEKPTYIRFAREASPVFTTENSPFKIGKAETFWDSKNPHVTIILMVLWFTGFKVKRSEKIKLGHW
jgi:transketolase